MSLILSPLLFYSRMVLGVYMKVTDQYRKVQAISRQTLPIHPQTRAIALKYVLSCFIGVKGVCFKYSR